MLSLSDSSSVWPAAAASVAVLVLYLTARTITSYWKLRHIPGPRLAGFSELWLFSATAKGNLYLTVYEVLRKYGSPARIGPNMIVTDDPESVREMTAARSPYRRGHWYDAMRFDPRINNTLSERDEKRHNDLRSKMMPAYGGKEVPDLEKHIDDRVMDLVNLIRREAVENQAPIDFAKLAQYFTLDSLTQIAFGYPFGFLIKNEDLYNYNKSSSEFFPILELGSNIPFIQAILSSRFMQALAGPKPEDKVGFGAIIGIAQKIIAERFSGKSESQDAKDMLNSFISHGLTQLEAESESLVQILAGADSTATTIRMAFLYLLTNPPMYAKLRKEIDDAIDGGKVSFPVITNREALELPYLQACIREGMRLWQPLTGIQTKLAPAEGVEISGIRIPGGTQITVNKYSMMRRKSIFGPDAEVFRPERWLGDPETVKGYERVWELSFDAGRFTCLGKGIALIELNKVFVELLRRFDFGLVNPVSPIETKCHQIHIQRNMNLHVWARTG